MKVNNLTNLIRTAIVSASSLIPMEKVYSIHGIIHQIAQNIIVYHDCFKFLLLHILRFLLHVLKLFIAQKPSFNLQLSQRIKSTAIMAQYFIIL